MYIKHLIQLKDNNGNDITAYGGSLNVSTGELTVDKVSRVFDGTENWTTTGSVGNALRYYLAVNDRKIGGFNIVDRFSCINTNSGSWGEVYFSSSTTNIIFHDNDGVIGSAAAFKEWLASNPTQVVYELATPQTYALTPQQITALTGENNIWSEGDTVSVSRYENVTSTKPYVVGIYGDKGQDGSNFKALTTGYSYTQDVVNERGTAGESYTWTVNEATTGLKVGDTVQIQIKNSSKNGDAFIVAIVTAISGKNVTARTIGLIDKGDVGKDGDPGFGVVAVVERNNFTDAQWNEYGTVGHLEAWGSTSSIRNGARIGDIFYVTGTSTDTGSSHTLTYVCDNTSGDLHGKCLGHTYAVGGKNATSYSLIVSHAAVVKAVDGTYNPTAITLTAKSQTGTAAMQNYSGRFKIETTTNGTTWTNTSSSSTKDEATKSFTIPANIIAVRCSLYASGGTTTLLDQQTVPIVSETKVNAITSVKEQYYLSTSNTVQPSESDSGWADTPQTYVSGRYYWTRSKITWEEGDPTYTTAVLANDINTAISAANTAQTSIDNLVVGGRNLYIVNKQVTGYLNGNTTTISPQAAAYKEVTSDFFEVTAGSPYSIQAWTPNNTGSNQPWIGYVFYSDADMSTAIRSRTAKYGDAGGTYLEYHNVIAPTGAKYMRVSYRTLGDPDAHIMVERSNRLNDWTPAPEDAISSLDVEYYLSTSASALSGGSWSTVAPAWENNKYMWSRQKVSYPNGVVEYKNQTCIAGAKGSTGTAGLNQATLYLYQRAASTPTTMPSGITYTYSTKTMSGTLGSWKKSIAEIGNGTDPIWITMATASSNGTTDTIADTEWTTPIKLAQNGGNGTPGYNQATIYLYQRAASAPAKPTAEVTYTFSNGTATGIPSGWSTTIPSGNNPCYVTSAAAISQTATAKVSGWSDVVKLVEDGEKGDDAYTIILTNENHTFSADHNGKPVAPKSATCGVIAYKGSTQIAASIDAITCPTGMTYTKSPTSGSSTTASFTVTVDDTLTTKNGTLTIPVTADGKTFNKVFTYTVTPDGPPGVSATGLAAIVNADGYSHSSNGEVYYHGYNDENKAADVDGWVSWNGRKVTIPKGYGINPDETMPYNTVLYSVYRLTSATADTGQFHDVCWIESSKGWFANTYSAVSTAPSARAAWTWNEATDIILAMYVEPSSEGAITNFQLFTPPKKYSELTEQINSKADAAGTAAANAQDAADQAQSDIDNLEIGGRNIARDSLPTNANSLWSVTNGTFATEDGYDCIKFVGALKQTGTGYPTFTMFNDTITNKRQLVPTNGAEFVFSADVKFVDVVKGTTNYFVSLYGGGATIDGTWRGPSYTTDGEHFTALTTSNLDPDKLNGKGWTRVWVKIAYSDTYEWPGVGICLYARDFTGTVFFKNIKIEKGNRPTDWTPAPEDTTSLISSLQTQVDGKIETWTQVANPASSWTAAERASHDGDLWYYIGETTTTAPIYKNNTTYKYTASTNTWSEYVVGTDIFSQINGKRSIFYGDHESGSFTGVATGDLLIEPDGTNYKWDGSKWVKVAEIQIGGRNLIRRTDYSVYGSDMYRNASKATFESDRITVQYGSEVYPISYPKNKLNMMIPSGTTVICSVHVFSQTIPDGYHRIYVSPLTESGTVSWVNIKVIPTGFTGKLTWTYTTTFDCYGFVQDFDTRNSTSGQMTLGRIKVEKGNRDTDWSPAPEDVSSEITTAVDNVSVGGRNLLRELDIRNHKATTYGVTYEYEGDGWWHIYGTYNSTSNTVFQMYGLSDSAIISTGGDQYTLSIENDGVLTVGHDSSAGIRVQVRRKKLSTDGILIDYYDASQSAYLFNVYEISTVKIHCNGSTMNGKTIDGRIRMKLEKGNKPTDWSPAPEDIAYNIAVGGRNLAASSKILPTVESVLVSETITESEHLYNINISGSNQGMYITTGHLTVGENYVLSYKFKKVSGTLSSIGGHCGGFTDVRAYMDGENIGGYHSAKAISDNTDTHSIVVYLKYAGGASDNRLYIQPNRSTTSTGVFDIWDIQLEKGDKATDWTPAPEDVDASIQTAVNSIEVGGRNYLKKSDIYHEEPYTYKGLTFEYEGNGWFHVSGTAASLSKAANYTLYGTPDSEYNITNDGTYTLSIENDGLPFDDATLMQISVGYFKAEDVSITSFYVNTDPTSDHESPRTYTGYSTGRIRVWLGSNLDGQAVDGRFRLKLEKGNRGTDWTPAPEDVESDLAKTKNDLNTKIDELVASEQAYRDTVTERVSTLEDFAIGEEQAQMIFNNQITTSEVIKTLQGDVLSTKTSTQTIYKYITFADGSIALSTDQAGAISLLIQNDRISFQQNGTEVAYISDRKLYITEAEILANSDKQGSLTLGNFAFTPQTNGSLSFKKVK